MSVELKVPQLGESVASAEIGRWLKAEGDAVAKDEPVVEIETDKATVELPAPAAGVLGKILKKKGESATVGETIGLLQEGAAAKAKEPAKNKKAPAAPREEPAQPRHADPGKAEEEPRIMPAARRALAEHDLRAADVKASGPGGRLLKEDVQRYAAARPPADGPVRDVEPPAEPAKVEAPAPKPASPQTPPAGERAEEVVPMTTLRKRIAERLVAAQQTAALLTTFNEIDLGEVIALRKEYRDEFQKTHGAKLGFMSFFVKAAVEALKAFPQLNAEIRGTDVVYRNYYDIGIAVGGGKGLVVPVLRNAERMSFAEIETAIADFAARAAENRLKLEEITGGTFTISNGGVYGSLLSTPIVNPPQSGVLGLHAIQERPVARDGEVVIRPMMYVALTYDHRIVDGRESVTFLKKIKDLLERPARMLLET